MVVKFVPGAKVRYRTFDGAAATIVRYEGNGFYVVHLEGHRVRDEIALEDDLELIEKKESRV